MKMIASSILMACLSTSAFASDCPQGKKTFAQWYQEDADYQTYIPSEFMLNSKACYLGHNKTGAFSSPTVISHDFLIQKQLLKSAEDRTEALEKVLVDISEKYDLFVDIALTHPQEEGRFNLTLSGWKSVEGKLSKFSLGVDVKL